MSKIVLTYHSFLYCYSHIMNIATVVASENTQITSLLAVILISLSFTVLLDKNALYKIVGPPI